MKKKRCPDCRMLNRIEHAENFTLKIGGELGDLCRISKRNAEKIMSLKKELAKFRKLLGGKCGR